MLTPFTKKNDVDFSALGKMLDWYVSNGVSGLFAVCQSSEMFFLNLDERVRIARFIKENTSLPVVASGHVSDGFDNQVEELNAIAETGIDAIILVVNRLVGEYESDETLMDRLHKLEEKLPADMPLGFYDCPYPYKRYLSPAAIEEIAKSNRYFFYKDTCGDIDLIRAKLDAMKGTNLRMYNANTATLIESLRDGSVGYSGVMANFHPELYSWLCDNYEDPKADKVADLLTLCSLIERQLYPVNAKYAMGHCGLDLGIFCRAKDYREFTRPFERETLALMRITEQIKQYIELEEVT